MTIDLVINVDGLLNSLTHSKVKTVTQQPYRASRENHLTMNEDPLFKTSAYLVFYVFTIDIACNPI